jgi:S-adenosylmethionine synthetase
MMNLVLSSLPQGDEPVEIVERKGLGHPDSICDALAETLSRNLCRHYLERFGRILAHNVDKALLCGGSAQPAFRGGSVTTPIDIYLSGRSVARVGDQTVPTEEIAIEGSRTWLRENLHALDADRHVALHGVLRPGSSALGDLFARSSTQEQKIPLANDTSIGVGYAPVSALERLVLRIEHLLNGRDRASNHPAWGEDIKVMGVRHGAAISLTIACAMIGRYLSDPTDYLAETAAIRRKVQDLAGEAGFEQCSIHVNAGDDVTSGSPYLAVTGNLSRIRRRWPGRPRQQGQWVDHSVSAHEPGSGSGQEPGQPCWEDLQRSRAEHRRKDRVKHTGSSRRAVLPRQSDWQSRDEARHRTYPYCNP